jgi:hypothetical protein
MKITLHQPLEAGTYTLTPEVVEPPAPEPKPTTRIPVFSPKVNRQGAPLHLVKPTTTQSMGADSDVAAAPWSLTPWNGSNVFYCPDRGQLSCWSSLGNIAIDGDFTGFQVHDVRSYQDTMYLLYAKDEKIHLAVSYDGTTFDTVEEVDTFGAKDTRHAFAEINSDSATIHGRVRGADWQEEVERWADRRGVKVIQIDFATGFCAWKDTIDPIDDYESRSAYKQAQIRTSYYASDGFMIGDTQLALVAVYFQDEQRIPKNRPERVNGTGSIYPVLFYFDGMDWYPLFDITYSPLDLNGHERESVGGFFEVGQIYSSELVWDSGDLVCPYVVRNDTHYEFGKIPFKSTEHFLARWDKGRIAYVTDCELKVDGTPVGFCYEGNEPKISGSIVEVDSDTKLYYIEL